MLQTQKGKMYLKEIDDLYHRRRLRNVWWAALGVGVPAGLMISGTTIARALATVGKEIAVVLTTVH